MVSKQRRTETGSGQKRFQLIGQSWHVKKTCSETVEQIIGGWNTRYRAAHRLRADRKERAMKLNSAQLERTLGQFEARAIPDHHPVIPQLNDLFGEHTFFLDRN